MKVKGKHESLNPALRDIKLQRATDYIQKTQF